MEKSAQPGEGGGFTPTSFHYIYHHVYKVVVYAPAERSDAFPYFYSTPIRTLWFIIGVRHVTGWDKDYLRKIPRVVW